MACDEDAAFFIDLEQVCHRLSVDCVELIEFLWRGALKFNLLLWRQLRLNCQVSTALIKNLTHSSHVHDYLSIDVLLLSGKARLAILLKIVAAQKLVELDDQAW